MVSIANPVYCLVYTAGGGQYLDYGQALRFASQESGSILEGEITDFGPPIVEPSLVAFADLLVALQEGDGSPEDRVRQVVSGNILKVEPGEIIATVFGYNSGGQVALIGPDGWLSEACVREDV